MIVDVVVAVAFLFGVGGSPSQTLSKRLVDVDVSGATEDDRLAFGQTKSSIGGQQQQQQQQHQQQQQQ